MRVRASRVEEEIEVGGQVLAGLSGRIEPTDRSTPYGQVTAPL